MINMCEKPYCVYIHINKINGKVYIGQTCKGTKQRWRKNGEGYKKNVYFYKAIQKYGWDNFKHIIVYKNLTQEEANYYERFLIKKYNALNSNYGYNLREGGSNLSGLDNPNYGNHKLAGENNPNAKAVLQYDLKGKLINKFKCGIDASNSLGVKNSSAISACCLGKHKSAYGFIWIFENDKDFIEKRVKEYELSKTSKKGKLSPSYGTHMREDLKKRFSSEYKYGGNPSAKAINQYSLDGIFIKKWSCAKEAANYYGHKYGTDIGKCAHKRIKSAYGYIWRFEGELL